MEPVELLRGALRRWRFAAIGAVVGALIAVAVAPAAARPGSRMWSATHTLILSANAGQAKASSGSAASANLATAALLVTKGEVPKRVAQQMQYAGDPDSLGASVTTKEDDATGTLSITATDRNRVHAADLANAFGHEVTAYLTEQAAATQQRALNDAQNAVQAAQAEFQRLTTALAAPNPPNADLLKAQRDAAIRTLATDNDRVQQLVASPPPAATLVTLDEASLANTSLASSTSAITNRRSVRALIGLLVGAMLGVAIAVGVELADPRVSDRAAAQRAFLLPVLAEVPQLPKSYQRVDEITTWDRPKSPVAAAYRHLRSALVIASVHETADSGGPVGALTNGHNGSQNGHVHAVVAERHPHVVLVTSVGPREGRTTTVANLAATFAESGVSVLVLGTDAYHADVHRLFGLPDGPGIHDLLLGDPRSAADLGRVVKRTKIPGVHVVTAGTPVGDPATLLTAKRYLVRRAKQMADVVLLDSPPLLGFHDAAELMLEADTVVVTGRAGQTRIRQARRSAEMLARIGVQPLGLNLVGVRGFLARFKRQGKLYRARPADSKAPGATGSARSGPVIPEVARRRQPSQPVSFETPEATS